MYIQDLDFHESLQTPVEEGVFVSSFNGQLSNHEQTTVVGGGRLNNACLLSDNLIDTNNSTTTLLPRFDAFVLPGGNGRPVVPGPRGEFGNIFNQQFLL